MEIFCAPQSVNPTTLRSASDLSMRVPYSSAAHCNLATNHFRKSDPHWLCAGPRLGLEFAGILECFVFFRPRNAQLDAYFDSGVDRTGSLSASGSALRNIPFCSLRGLLYPDFPASRLGWFVVLRQSILCFVNADLRSRTGSILRLACARVAGTSRRDLCIKRDGSIDCLEPGAHFPMGHTLDSSARPDFLA